MSHITSIRPLTSKELLSEEEIIRNWVGWDEASPPQVSICCTSFNHRPYLESAVCGFLSQETSFPFEVLINDDASTDGSQEVIQSYAKRYPRIIKPIYQSENQYSKGIKPLLQLLLTRVTAKYIAICEGDDYWIATNKLHDQVSALEDNSDLVASFHDVAIRWHGSVSDSFVRHWNPNFDCRSAIVGISEIVSAFWLVPTASILFRSDCLRLVEGIESMPNTDFPLMVSLASQGDFHFTDKVMGVYRKDNPGSITNNRNILDRIAIRSHRIELFTQLRRMDAIDGDLLEKVVLEECRLIKASIEVLKKNVIFRFYLRIAMWWKKRKLGWLVTW